MKTRKIGNTILTMVMLLCVFSNSNAQVPTTQELNEMIENQIEEGKAIAKEIKDHFKNNNDNKSGYKNVDEALRNHRADELIYKDGHWVPQSKPNNSTVTKQQSRTPNNLPSSTPSATQTTLKTTYCYRVAYGRCYATKEEYDACRVQENGTWYIYPTITAANAARKEEAERIERERIAEAARRAEEERRKEAKRITIAAETKKELKGYTSSVGSTPTLKSMGGYTSANSTPTLKSTAQYATGNSTPTLKPMNIQTSSDGQMNQSPEAMRETVLQKSIEKASDVLGKEFNDYLGRKLKTAGVLPKESVSKQLKGYVQGGITAYGGSPNALDNTLYVSEEVPNLYESVWANIMALVEERISLEEYERNLSEILDKFLHKNQKQLEKNGININ